LPFVSISKVASAKSWKTQKSDPRGFCFQSHQKSISNQNLEDFFIKKVKHLRSLGHQTQSSEICRNRGFGLREGWDNVNGSFFVKTPRAFYTIQTDEDSTARWVAR